MKETEIIFDKEFIERKLPETFKGLSKQYILDAMFNDSIQSKWVPEKGDLIVLQYGNIMTISGIAETPNNEPLYLMGVYAKPYITGSKFERTGTFTYTMGKKDADYGGSLFDMNYHFYLEEFRFVPYPHETNRM